MMSRVSPALCAGLILMTTGCTGSRGAAGWPEGVPLGAELDAYRPPADPGAAPDEPDEADDPTGVLTMSEALALALRHNPDLAVFGWEVRALDAAAVQAALPENPEIEAELEEMGGAGSTRGPSGSVATLAVGQTFRGPGTLLLRGRAARLERDLAGWDYEAARIDLVTGVRQRFIDVLAGQERLAAARQLAALADQARKTVAGQVEAGVVSPVELTRAEVELSLVRLEQERAARDLLAARQRLAELWGGRKARFERVAAEDLGAVEPPPVEALLDLVEDNPDVARWATERERRRTEVRLARAEGVPALTLRGGVQRLGETGDTAAVVGVSIPLPLFDVNQGGVREARAREAQAWLLQRAAQARVRAELETAYQELSASYTEYQTLSRTALPGAMKASDSTNEAYRQGKAPLMDVLDAQRTSFRVMLQTIDAKAAYRRALARIERLIGRPLPTPAFDDPQDPNGRNR